MHTVHLPNEELNRVKYAAVGLMFSVDDYTRDSLTEGLMPTIDAFFDSLEWTTTDSNPKVPEVPYGKLMMHADLDNRWTYKGSVTTPPCDTFVYWNVAKRIFPIKQAHLDQFKSQMARDNLTSNWREIQDVNEHNPKIVSVVKPKEVNSNDLIDIRNTEDGSVILSYNATDGSAAVFNPMMTGDFLSNFTDSEDRAISITTVEGNDLTIPSLVPASSKRLT